MCKCLSALDNSAPPEVGMQPQGKNTVLLLAGRWEQQRKLEQNTFGLCCDGLGHPSAEKKRVPKTLLRKEEEPEVKC